MLERLQKILSARGICSRRKAEEYILKGLVKVNGKVVKVGDKADPETDVIEIDGKIIEARREMLYYVMNKPVGVVTENVDSFARLLVCSKKRKNEKTKKRSLTVRDLLPEHLQGKIYPVGRLDKETSGLLLLTNDGVLAYRLTHPKFDHEKEYAVTLDRPFPDRFLWKLSGGVWLKGERTKPARAKRLGASCFSLVLTEGRNRQIRRVCQQYGYTVKSLKRVRIVTLEDSTLGEGSVRPLTEKEREQILRSIEVEPR